MNPLDLYAKIETLIGFDEQYEKLYKIYLEWLDTLHVKRILDVGCGNGKFLAHLQAKHFNAQGIDRSVQMVERAVRLGVNASTQELNELPQASFDCVVAIADVINYIPPNEVASFFEAVNSVLKPGGYFLCDVNTLYGFESVADGVMCKETETEFLCIEATFEAKELLTNITLFEKEADVYQKYQGSIMQYFHSQTFLKKIGIFKFCTTKAVSLFAKESDKTIMLLQKK
ncbi:MAG: class I SAM-dependent methyltransferase [Sulfurospirillaceae bacterium]|nr:class I SAM-dependent methyltransferase [Sulfurospirillaceae bacterium]